MEGDGIYVAGGTLVVDGGTVATNGGYGIYRAGGTIAISNSIVWGNGDDLSGVTTGVSYTCVEDGDFAGVAGCFSEDPLFADTVHFHLQSRAGHYAGGYFTGGSWSYANSNSLCIDAGDPAAPWGLEPSPHGGRVNLGAYGNTEVASKTGGQGTFFMLF